MRKTTRDLSCPLKFMLLSALVPVFRRTESEGLSEQAPVQTQSHRDSGRYPAIPLTPLTG